MPLSKMLSETAPVLLCDISAIHPPTNLIYSQLETQGDYSAIERIFKETVIFTVDSGVDTATFPAYSLVLKATIMARNTKMV